MRILLVEDDRDLCDTTAIQLEKAGYEVDRCYHGDEGYYYALENPYDVIILDRMLPGMNGLTLLSSIRKKAVMTPVIITTALNGLYDRVHGLDAGADDYLVKPFAVEELLARIRAVTRRPGRIGISKDITFADLILDPKRRELSCASSAENMTTLSGRESALLEYLMRNGEQTLTRGQILSYIWGPDSEVEEGNLDNYIYFIRRRLKALHCHAKIRTVHGVGYRLEKINHETT